MPCQLGWCNGHNTKLNCLEYHRDSEFNLGTEDFVLLLARQEEIAGGKLDTAKVKAFRAPAGTLVEVYATTLHYAPCHVDAAKGTRVLVALPKGTNTAKPAIKNDGGDDPQLWACNKWLLAHPDSAEAKAGAYVGLVGKISTFDSCRAVGAGHVGPVHTNHNPFTGSKRNAAGRACRPTEHHIKEETIMKSSNIPEVKLGIIAVSRDCFPSP